jgi:hypothetical protein
VVLAAGLEPVETVVGVEDVPSGFATVAPCVGDVELATGFALETVADAAGVPNGLDTVAAGVAEGGTLAGATVADRTFAVMLADPAELGLAPTDAGAPVTGVVACAVATAAALPAGLESDATLVLVLGVVAAVVAAGVVAFDAGAMLTATEAGAFPFVDAGGFGADAVCTVSAGDEGLVPGFTLPGVPAPFCATGTVPAPGVPIPGNTVPCCRLPSFGLAEEGVADAAAVAGGCVATGGCFSGKLMGGNLGGTGMGAGAAVAPLVGSCGFRRNTFISGALAAGGGPFRRAADALSAA